MKIKSKYVWVVVVLLLFIIVPIVYITYYKNPNNEGWPVVYAKIISTHNEDTNCGDSICSTCYLDLEFEYDNMMNKAQVESEFLTCDKYVGKYIKVIVNPEKSVWGSYTRGEVYEWKTYENQNN